MSGLASGLELAILSLVLLFAWLAVAVYASADLAFAVGLGVMLIWFFFFVPSGLIRELIWQSRQKKIMQQALSAPAYQPGSALPAPERGNELVLAAPSGGAIDIYRDDLPQLLPQLEPRRHASAFKRSLVLPLLSALMMIGASNDTFMQKLLEARGIMEKLPIEWAALKLPPAYESERRYEMDRAARAVLEREGGCSRITHGSMVAFNQFAPPAEQTRQIVNGEYLYEFYCKASNSDEQQHLVWITPDEIDRGSFAGLASQFATRLTPEKALTACLAAANEQLKPLQASLSLPPEPVPGAPGQPAVTTAPPEPQVFPGRLPYADYVRLITLQVLNRASGPPSLVNMSCWASLEGGANIRFYKAN